MIARKHDDRAAGAIQQADALIDDGWRLPVVVEDITNEQNVVCLVRFRGIQHDTQAGGAIIPVWTLMRIGIDMKVGAMDEHDFGV
jgi:hypothetical protein